MANAITELRQDYTEELVGKFQKFFDDERLVRELGKAAERGEGSFNINWADLSLRESQLGTDFAIDLLDHPDIHIRSAEEAIARMHIPVAGTESAYAPHARFHNLPDSRRYRPMVLEMGAEELDKLVSLEGVISSISEIKPRMKIAAWECRNCRRTFHIPTQKIEAITPPLVCPNGECRKNAFRLVEEQSVFINQQRAQIQDPVEKMRGNVPPSQLHLWLEEDLVNQIAPGDKVVLTGVLRLKPITQQKARNSVYDKFFEVIHIREMEIEFEELVVSREEEEEILRLAKDPKLFDKIVASIAPTIFGHTELKQAIALQLFGGTAGKSLPDGKNFRSDLHIVMIGDPGCLSGDERIILGNGAVVKIGEVASEHLQKINLPVLTGEGGAKRDVASVFHRYCGQPVMEIVTESGKAIVGTPNHPLLCLETNDAVEERKWKRLDQLRLGDRLATVTGIPCTIRKCVPTGFKPLPAHPGPKFSGKLPPSLTPNLAALLGYVLGDGWVTDTEVGFVVAEPEKDILPQLVVNCENEFGLTPRFNKHELKNGRTIPLHYYSIYSKDIASNLKFLRSKRVPGLVMRSGNGVVAAFLKWLFEADGTVFDNGRARRAVGLKSANTGLLRDVQVLLLRFGIHSRIVSNALLIRRGFEIKKFAREIGFVSQKKRGRLETLAGHAEKFSRAKGQRSERIVKISILPPQDVYDIEVPNSHRFIANGIISHNTGKSTMMEYVAKLAPKCIVVSGGSSSAVGLTASAVKDEIGEGWILKAGAMVLANGGVVAVDELDKLDEEDRGAMHQAMEQQKISVAKAGIVTEFKTKTSVLAAANPKHGRFDPNSAPASQFDISPALLSVDGSEPILVREGGIAKLMPISELVDKFYEGEKAGNPVHVNGVEVAAFSPDDYKICWRPAQYVFRHETEEQLYELGMETGRRVKLTPGHSVFVLEDGGVRPKKTCEIKKGDFVVIPKRLPGNPVAQKEILIPRELSKLPNGLAKGIYLHDVPASVFGRVKNIPEWWNERAVLSLEFSKELSDEELRQCSLKVKGGLKNGVPCALPVDGRLARLLGYYIAEGSLFVSGSNEHIISLSFGAHEKNLHADVKEICKELFGHDVTFVRDRGGLKVNIANKVVYLLFAHVLGLTRGAHDKEIPKIVMNMEPPLQKEFMKACHDGDYCVTVSEKLINGLLYLLAQHGCVSSVHVHKSHHAVLNDGRMISGGRSFALVDADRTVNSFVGVKEYGMVPLAPMAPCLESVRAASWKGGKSPYFGKRASCKQAWKKSMRRNSALRLEWLQSLAQPKTAEEFASAFESKVGTLEKEQYRSYAYKLIAKGLVSRQPSGRKVKYGLTQKAGELLRKMGNCEKLFDGDLAFVKVTSLSRVPASGRFVYDVSVPDCENFVAGFGGVVCHNSRFDLIFTMRDTLDEARDKGLARHLLEGHVLAGTHGKSPAENPNKPAIPVELLRKYIAYARRTCLPQLTEEATGKIGDYYVDLRKIGKEQNTFPITARQIEGLIRLAEASAKMRLSPLVELQDADRAVKLEDFVLHEVFVDRETGKLDSDVINIGQAKSRIDRVRNVLNIVSDLEKQFDLVGIDDVVREASNHGVDEFSCRHLIDELKRKGELYEPKAGFVKLASRKDW